ncbi:hypothetical protein ABZS71_33995 [Streptomyces sp. NPDC005393]|uniref:hypothetical protein n=1 Tax=Streptomyces sp. NPDC005393 TaxID=3157041 RepID=UPI0033A0B824
MRSRSVIIVLHEGVRSLDVTGPLEVFTGAVAAGGQPGVYQVMTAGPGDRPVRTCSGLRLLPDDDLNHVEPAHTLVVLAARVRPTRSGTGTPHR